MRQDEPFFTAIAGGLAAQGLEVLNREACSPKYQWMTTMQLSFGSAEYAGRQ